MSNGEPKPHTAADLMDELKTGEELLAHLDEELMLIERKRDALREQVTRLRLELHPALERGPLIHKGVVHFLDDAGFHGWITVRPACEVMLPPPGGLAPDRDSLLKDMARAWNHPDHDDTESAAATAAEFAFLCEQEIERSIT